MERGNACWSSRWCFHSQLSHPGPAHTGVQMKLCLCWIQMGRGDNAAISLIQDSPFHESGVCGVLQNGDASSKAIRPSLAKLFLIEALTRKIYHLSKQQVLQHPLAVSRTLWSYWQEIIPAVQPKSYFLQIKLICLCSWLADHGKYLTNHWHVYFLSSLS